MAALAMLGGQNSGPIALPREFRAAWVATVDNIDWPSKPGLTTATQKAELLAILDRAAELRLNAIVLQVRPMCDALYKSDLEPWSSFLTGEQGRGPVPSWDPLEFAVAEAHRRGLELHAWFNPYRAKHPAMKGDLSARHVGQQHPAWAKTYGKYLWLDPGDLAAREHSLKVIEDVVRRYDLDGVHIDDYFYPYPENDPTAPDGTKKVLDFPDGPSRKVYTDGGGTLPLADWRRENVDKFVEAMYARVKAAKPWVKVGISPFGIYRPGFPASVKAGFDQYAALYADPRRWLTEGWCDYMAPQLYWRIGSPQPYADLLAWWSGNNPKGRFIWPGSFTSQVRTSADWPVSEIVEQVSLSRTNPNAPGHIHFSVVALMKDAKGLGQALLRGPYAAPAAVPAMPWSRSRPSVAPRLRVEEGKVVWTHLRPQDVRFWTVYGRAPSKWVYRGLIGAAQMEIPVSQLAGFDQVAIGALDKYGLESPLGLVTLGGASKLAP